MALLEIAHVSKSYGEGAARQRVLCDIGLAVREGEFVVLVGPSGAGKSTLLGMLAGLVRPDEGSIELGGTSVREPGLERGVVFQHDALLPWLSAYANVRLAVDAAFPRESAQARHARTERTLELVNLSAAHDKRPHELSGGMRQRVAVARALAMDPAILLLDEPFSALDALTRTTLQEELERIRLAARKTVLMVTNDLDEALLLADRVVPLGRDGRLGAELAVGLPHPRRRAELNHDPRYKALRAELAARLAPPSDSTSRAREVRPLPDVRPDHERGGSVRRDGEAARRAAREEPLA